MTPELERLLKESSAKVRAMTPEAREAMYRQQRDGYVKAEMSWPKPKFHWETINGQLTKVYHSYEDYLND